MPPGLLKRMLGVTTISAQAISVAHVIARQNIAKILFFYESYLKKATMILMSIYSILKTCFVVCSIFVTWFPFSYITFSIFSDS